MWGILLFYQSEMARWVGKVVPDYKRYSFPVFKLSHRNCCLACKLVHLSWRQRVPVWLQCNLHYPNLCARTHLSLWPRGSHRQWPRGCSCLSVRLHVCVCDHVGSTGSGGQVSRGKVPGPWACLLPWVSEWWLLTAKINTITIWYCLSVL